MTDKIKEKQKGKKIIRLKYSLTFIILTIVIYFNWKEIPIQDNFVATVKWLLIAVFTGFAIKKMQKLFGNNKEED